MSIRLLRWSGPGVIRDADGGPQGLDAGFWREGGETLHPKSRNVMLLSAVARISIGVRKQGGGNGG